MTSSAPTIRPDLDPRSAPVVGSSSQGLPAEQNNTEHLARLNRMVAGVIACSLLAVALYLFSDVMVLLFAAMLIACQLYGAASFIERHLHLAYLLSLALVVLTLVGSAGALIWFRGPDIVNQAHFIAGDIHQQLPAFWHSLGDAKWVEDAIDRVHSYIDNLKIAGYAAGFVTSTIGSLGSALLVVVAAIYFAVSPHTYVAGAAKLVPQSWRPATLTLLGAEGHQLRRWFLGQLADMFAIGILTSLGLYLLGIKLWPMLGLFAGLCNFVPYIGALAGSVPAILVAFSESPSKAVDVALLFAAVQTFEGNVLAPLIQRRTVELPPVLTLFSQTVLGALLGPLGLILATPLTAAAMLLVERIYIGRVLEQKPIER